MAERAEGNNRVVALTWAAIAEVGLAGVILLWLISPSAAGSAGYGSPLSMVLLIVAMLFTAVGGLVVLVISRLSRGVRLAATLLLAAAAGGVIPLAITGLSTAGGGGYGLLLILAVIGMEFLAVQIPRAIRMRPQCDKEKA